MSHKMQGKVMYLQGLADGLELDATSKEGKLLLKIIETLGDFAAEIAKIDGEQKLLDEIIEGMEESIDEIEETIDEIEETIEEIAETLLLDEHDCDDDDDWLEEQEEDTVIHQLSEGGFIEYACPHCQSKIYYDAKAFDLSEDHTCPDCGKELFPEDDQAE